MKNFLFFLIAILYTSYGFSQTTMEKGDDCFQSGDYKCAVANYAQAVDLLDGRNKQLAELKLGRAKTCSERLETADLAFENRYFDLAKENYNLLLEENPNDPHAKEQLLRIEDLRKRLLTLSVSKKNIAFNSNGNTERINVTTNAEDYKISMLPPWCTIKQYDDYFEITASANSGNSDRNDYFFVEAEHLEERINISQPHIYHKPETFLTLSGTQIKVGEEGGISQVINVNTNESNYTFLSLPSWCKIKSKYSGWFNLEIEANPNPYARESWFLVMAGNKEVRVYIEQPGKTKKIGNYSTKPSPSKANKKSRVGSNNCFNCPKGRNSWGITFGYVKMDYPLDITPYEYISPLEGFQLGIKFEPLFKYGFGINTGLLLEAYANEIGSIFDQKLTFYNFNIPLHLEYRFNFDRAFNLFAYGGVGANLLSDGSFSQSEFLTTYEYGGGIRINRIQFNVGQRKDIGNGEDSINEGNEKTLNQKLMLSISFMF